MSGPVLRVVIADDEPLVRRGLRAALGRLDLPIEVVGEARHGDEAIATVAALDPDVILLDIDMPGVDGIAVARTIAAVGRPAIVFVTAHDRFAVDAFALHAVDYLLKPVEPSRLDTALRRVVARLAGPGDDVAQAARTERLLAALHVTGTARRAPRPAHLLVRTGATLVLVAVADVRYCTAEDNYVRLHVTGGSHLLRATLGALEATLDPARFVRVHRSTLVALDQVASLTPLPSGDATLRLQDGTTLVLSRRFRAAFAARIGMIG